jgi:hypothetical protein
MKQHLKLCWTQGNRLPLLAVLGAPRRDLGDGLETLASASSGAAAMAAASALWPRTKLGDAFAALEDAGSATRGREATMRGCPGGSPWPRRHHVGTPTSPGQHGRWDAQWLAPTRQTLEVVARAKQTARTRGGSSCGRPRVDCRQRLVSC